MNAALFQVELVGGPDDGLFTQVGTFPGRTVFLPARPADTSESESGGGAAPAVHVALYELARGQYSCDMSGFPIISLRYEFAKIGATRGRATPAGPDRRLRSRESAVRSHDWLRSLRHRLATWVMEPIDYPMKLGPVVRPDATREARCESEELW